MFKRSLVFSLIIIFLGVNLAYAGTQKRSWELTDEEIQLAIELGRSQGSSLYDEWEKHDSSGTLYRTKPRSSEPKLLVWTPFRHVVFWATPFSLEGVGFFWGSNDKGEVVVKKVMENSPAQKSGMLPGDIIREVDGKSIKSVNDISALIDGPVGKKIKITIERDGKTQIIEVTRSVYTTTTTYEDIKRGLEKYTELLKISVTFYGDWVDFAKNYHCVIQIGDKLLYPVRVENQEIANKTVYWPESPAYFAFCRYYFSTEDIPRDAIIRIIIPEDPRADWTIDLSEIP